MCVHPLDGGVVMRGIPQRLSLYKLALFKDFSVTSTVQSRLVHDGNDDEGSFKLLFNNEQFFENYEHSMEGKIIMMIFPQVSSALPLVAGVFFAVASGLPAPQNQTPNENGDYRFRLQSFP